MFLLFFDEKHNSGSTIFNDIDQIYWDLANFGEVPDKTPLSPSSRGVVRLSAAWVYHLSTLTKESERLRAILRTLDKFLFKSYTFFVKI